jgi:hypothetical protein
MNRLAACGMLTRVRRMRTTWLPVLGLAVLAPWMAEFSWGGLGVTDLAVAMLFLAPLYGGAAVLVREVARRSGRGWPTMLLLGVAFGLLQAGIVDQSLFNPSYARFDFQHPAHVSALGFSAFYLIAFVVGHAITSIGVPIALVEACTPRHRDRPWLGRAGLGVVAVLYLAASLVNHVGVKEVEHFQASAGQVAAVLAATAVVLAAALATRPRPPVPGWVPPAVVPGAIALLASSFYLPVQSWGGVAVAVGTVVVVGALVGRWSRRQAWNRRHTLAVAAGAALGGAWMPFFAEPYDPTVSGRVELADDLVAATVPVLLVAFAFWRSSTPTRRAALPVGRGSGVG